MGENIVWWSVLHPRWEDRTPAHVHTSLIADVVYCPTDEEIRIALVCYPIQVEQRRLTFPCPWQQCFKCLGRAMYVGFIGHHWSLDVFLKDGSALVPVYKAVDIGQGLGVSFEGTASMVLQKSFCTSRERAGHLRYWLPSKHGLSSGKREAGRCWRWWSLSLSNFSRVVKKSPCDSHKYIQLSFLTIVT